MIILSERGFNLHFYNITNKKGFNFENDFIVNRKDDIEFVAKKGSTFSLNCFKFLDFLSSVIRERFEKQFHAANPEVKFPLKTEKLMNVYPLLLNPSEIYNFKDSVNNENFIHSNLKSYNISISIPIKTIKKYMNTTNSNWVKDIIKQISNYWVKTNYAINSKKADDRFNKTSFGYDFKYSNIDSEFDHLFDYEFVNKTIGKDGKKYNNECVFTFNTNLGACFIHNIFTGGYQLYKEDMYSLSGSSQLVYRKKFFIYNKIKTTLNQNNVHQILNTTTKNVTERKKIFNRVIEELVDRKFVKFSKKFDNGSIELKRDGKDEEQLETSKVVSFFK